MSASNRLVAWLRGLYRGAWGRIPGECHTGWYLLSTPVEVGWSSFTVALGGAGVIPVSGWASWPVKEIVAPGLSSKQTRLRACRGWWGLLRP
jgi:hypothetical protein